MALSALAAAVLLLAGEPPRPATAEALFDAAATADAVFLGERHDDPAAHALQLQLLQDLARRGRPVVLAMEMFEQDQQPFLDAYVAGRIAERDFQARVALWPNYRADYRPLVEFAKARGWPVVGSNVPRRDAARAAREGLKSLVDCPAGPYRDRFGAAVGEGHGKLDVGKMFEAQCLKDETMARSVAASMRPGATVVHVNGAFHTGDRLGIVPRLERLRPEARIVVADVSPDR